MQEAPPRPNEQVVATGRAQRLVMALIVVLAVAVSAGLLAVIRTLLVQATRFPI